MLDFVFKENEFFSNGLLSFLLTFIFLYTTACIVDKMIKKVVTTTITKKGDKAKNLLFIYKVVKVIVYTLAIFLSLLEFKPFNNFSKTMLGASTIIATITGFAAQESLSNLVSGFFLALYQPFVVGDLITIRNENITGTVLEIGLRHTTINTFENTRIIIPNSIMNKAIIENKEAEEINYNNFLYLTISYDSDIDLAKKIIADNCQKHPLVLDCRTAEEKAQNEPVVKIFVTNFLDSAVELRATVITSSVANGFKTLSDLRQSIKKDFDAQGITIPFPTTTVYVDR